MQSGGYPRGRSVFATVVVLVLLVFTWGLAPVAHAADEVQVSTAEEFYRAFSNASTSEPTLITLKNNIVLSSNGTMVDKQNRTTVSLKPGQNITLRAADGVANATIENNVNSEFLRVPKDSSLMLSKGVWFRGKTTHGTHQVNVDGGTFTMSEGSKLYGSRRMSRGAIYVHNGGIFSLEGGEISDNTPDEQSSVTAGALTIEGGTANLDSGKISKNGLPIENVSATSSEADYYVGGAIAVRAGGTLNIGKDVEISENKGNYGGAIIAVSTQAESAAVDGSGKDSQEAAVVNIEGGTLKGNVAQRDGGGVFAMGNARVSLSGGSIEGNTTKYGTNDHHGHGGGIAMWDACFGTVGSGRKGTDRCENPLGDSSKSTADDFAKYYPAAFTMTGGTIKNNHAGYTGGGLYLATQNATISGGEVLQNQAQSYGGGITVPTQPYKLTFTQPTLVTGNEATGDRASSASYGGGGGIWSDSFGSVLHGASIVENRAKSPDLGPDFAAYGYRANGPWEGEKTLRNRIAGGGAASWTKEQGDTPLAVDPKTAEVKIGERIAAQAHASDETISLARVRSNVLIEGNNSQRGGGIATSGTVVFPEEDLTNVEACGERLRRGSCPYRYSGKRIVV